MKPYSLVMREPKGCTNSERVKFTGATWDFTGLKYCSNKYNTYKYSERTRIIIYLFGVYGYASPYLATLSSNRNSSS